MKVNEKIISIPPYLSTSWKFVKALHLRSHFLIVHLKDGETIQIPQLDKAAIDLIFQSHAAYLEQETVEKPIEMKKIDLTQELFNIDLSSATPLKMGMSALENLGTPLQHNPAQMNAPDLPGPILEKIASIARIVGPEDMDAFPKPEPHCNCLHCQIAKAILNETASSKMTEVALADELVEIEEEVKEEDLTFQQWDIQQTGNKLFSVVNRLDAKEKYSVYLGHPVGCTCGKTGCEHIVAVLKS